VWTLAVDGVELAELRGSARHDAHAFAAYLGTRLGERLGEFHRLPQLTFPRRAPRPWPLGHDLLPSMEAAPRTDELEEVLDAWFEPEVRAALDRARASWDRRCSPVHGDLSAHNVIVDLAAQGTAVTFIDLEACGLGDPDWDVVSLLRSLDEVLDDPALASLGRASFLAAYAHRSGRGGGPDPAFACARALATAWQCASHPLQQVRSRTAYLLDEARQVADSPAVAS
jgi:aminoglycoside phosphotransferase (APT) family kinase protein